MIRHASAGTLSLRAVSVQKHGAEHQDAAVMPELFSLDVCSNPLVLEPAIHSIRHDGGTPATVLVPTVVEA